MELQSLVASRFVTLIECNNYPVIEVNFNKLVVHSNGELMAFFYVIQMIELQSSTDEEIEYDEKINTFGLFVFKENMATLFNEKLSDEFILSLN